MPDLYTPQSNTAQGKQQQSFSDLLSTIQNMPASSQSPVSQQQATQAQANAMNFQQQAPAYFQQQQQNLTQQAGIPQLQGQYGNLSDIFNLYLKDQNLSQKYTSPQLQSPNSPVYSAQPQNQAQASYVPNYQGPQNPYLNAPQDIINAVTQPVGQGFQGFTSPSLNTAAMSAVPTAATNIMGLLQGAIGQEQGLVANKMGDVSQNYQTALNTLDTIANLYGQEYQNQLASRANPGAVYGSTAQAAQVFNSVLDQLGPNATPSDVWNYINVHDSSLRSQGVNVDELWRLQKDMANKKVTSTATGKVPVSKTKVQSKTVAGKVYNYDPATGIYTDPITKQRVDPNQPAGIMGTIQSLISGLTSSSKQPAKVYGSGTVHLQDMQGNIYGYPSKTDKDYLNRIKQGWRPV